MTGFGICLLYTSDPDTGKKTSKLTFEDKKKPPAKVSQGIKEAPVHLVAGKLHKEIRETEQDNVGVESAHKSEEAVAEKPKVPMRPGSLSSARMVKANTPLFSMQRLV